MKLQSFRDGFIGARSRLSSLFGMGSAQGRAFSDKSDTGLDGPRDTFVWGAAMAEPGRLSMPDRARLRSAGKLSGFASMTSPTPIRLPAIGPKVRHVDLGSHHSTAVTDDGKLYVWGYGHAWELGTGHEIDTVSEPSVVGGELAGVAIKSASCGDAHTMALSEAGEVFTWGWGGNPTHAGALGHGEFKDVPTPRRIDPKRFGGSPVVQICAGRFHSLALTADGVVYAWGRGENGVTGMSRWARGVASSSHTPQAIEYFQQRKGKDRVVYISSTNVHSGAITESGQLYTWGSNPQGQIGGESIALTQYKSDPIPMPTQGLVFETIRDFSAGENASIALNDEHEVYAWGDNIRMPDPVLGPDDTWGSSTIVQVACGDGYYGALDSEGHLYLWGNGDLLSSIDPPTGDDAEWMDGAAMAEYPKRRIPVPMRFPGFGEGEQYGRALRLFGGRNGVAVIAQQP